MAIHYYKGPMRLRVNGVEVPTHSFDNIRGVHIPASDFVIDDVSEAPRSGAFPAAVAAAERFRVEGSFKLDAAGADAVAAWLREIERLEAEERALSRERLALLQRAERVSRGVVKHHYWRLARVHRLLERQAG